MTAPAMVAIVHYHLRRGGVTRVIQHAVAALADTDIQCVVLAGEPPPDGVELGAPVTVVEGLGYDDHRAPPTSDALLRAVQDKAREALGTDPDLWHIHNHTLGKNPSWSHAVMQLAEAGERLVLQIHDFAEDGRPANYRHLKTHLPDLDAVLYPGTAHTQYALLNSRDRDLLLAAGASEAQTHLLPNAVWTGASDARQAEPDEREPPLILYPTRAIRRKNIGEFLLWSAVERGATTYGVTLAPESPAEKPAYERWKAFAREAGLPVAFEMGMTEDFEHLLRRATALATTSIAEGFGLAFLEPWLAGRALVGRNLPEITRAFVELGLDLDGLYDELWIPAEWVDVALLNKRIRAGFKRAREAYGLALTEDDAQRAEGSAFDGPRVAFGKLDEALQEQVIRHVRKHGAPGMEPDRLRWREAGDSVPANGRVTATEFSLSRYRDRLVALYEQAMKGGPASGHRVSAQAVLNAFASPARFSLLRSL